MSAVQPSSDLAFERWPNCLTCLAEQGVRGPGGFDGMRKRMEAAAGREMPFSEAGALGRTAASGGLWPIAGLGMKFLFVLVVVVLGGVRGLAATKTWNGTGDWFLDVGNWSGGVPADGDDAVVASGTVTLTSSTPLLTSLTLAAGTLVCSNWDTTVRAAQVIVQNGAVLSCAGPFTNAPAMSNRVHVVCSNLTVDAGGLIDVTGRGYAGGQPGQSGCGPGAGWQGFWTPGGAGHGGYGGFMIGAGLYLTSGTYGDPVAPVLPGSGGGGSTGAGTTGTAGGGAVRIEAADQVVVNGAILADGGPSIGMWTRAATGSGGSIFITCRSLIGTGRISASGGASEYIGGEAGTGGGGRIAVINDPPSQASYPPPCISFSAREGTLPVYPASCGGIGSIYLSDACFLLPGLTNVAGRLEGPCSIATDSLTVTNVFGFGRDVQVTVSNNVVVNGSRACLELGCPDVIWLGVPYRASPVAGLRFRVGGDLLLTNGAKMVVASGPTSNPQTNFGTVVTVDRVFELGPGTRVEVRSHPTNGASPEFHCRHLIVASNALFTAGAWNNPLGGEWTNMAGGYACAWGNVGAAGSGHNLWGWGWSLGAGYAGGGAGHGGAGYPYSGQGGEIYDVTNNPCLPGSGGGCGNANWGGGGAGGGLVRVLADGVITLCSNSRIEADGAAGRNHVNADRIGGGGAGGAIYLRCRTFVGESGAVLSARGGRAALNTGGGGGGGIISIWRVSDRSTGSVTIDVTGGRGRLSNADKPEYDGQSGVVIWGQIPAPGTIICIQ